MRPRALLAEFLGTFGLTLAVLMSINNPGFPVPTPVLAALAVGVFVYMVGSISGCHINPAVTIGLAAISRIDIPTSGLYIASQLAGAAAAMVVGASFVAVPVDVVADTSVGVGLAEMIGAAVLVFGITAVVMGRVPAAANGVVIGGSLLLGISLAAHTSNGLLNPAVALGIGSVSLPYIWGPILGGVLGAMLGQVVSDPDAT